MRIKPLLKFRNYLYNKQHSTDIRSTEASLNACYEKHVHIAPRTIVTEDVTIGKYSYVNTGSSIENCTIGNYCSISSGVWICPFEHDTARRSTHPFTGSVPKRAPVTIGHDVLISLNAIILSGVTIGNGAVIGAGAVVTKDVAPFEVVGGVPAKHIGWRFAEAEQQRIQSSGWWNYDREILEKNLNYFKGITDDFNP